MSHVGNKKYDHKNFENGVNKGKQVAMELFASKFEQLSNVKGIGSRTIQKLQNHFGNDFFLKQLESIGNQEKEKRAGDCYKPLVRVHKAKKGVPTVIMVDGVRYILDSESARRVFK